MLFPMVAISYNTKQKALLELMCRSGQSSKLSEDQALVPVLVLNGTQP